MILTLRLVTGKEATLTDFPLQSSAHLLVITIRKSNRKPQLSGRKKEREKKKEERNREEERRKKERERKKKEAP